MTLTERNNLQYDLRHKMWLAQMEVETYKEAIAQLNRDYKEQFKPDLFEQMFGDTPMAEEVYGG
jgi:hypothetical protein